MKILVTADLHGYGKAYQEFAHALKCYEFDVGVLCGDLMTFPSENHLLAAKQELESQGVKIGTSNGATDPEVVERALQKKQKEYKQVLRSSGKPVVFVMGNDDGLLGSGCAWSSEKGIVNINQRRAKLGKYSFVGYHYTSPFIGGTFEKTESEQTKDFEKLAELIDENTVLVTHGPPWGILDKAANGRNLGSKALRRLIEKKSPRLHLFGHIHGAFGIQGIWANGAYPGSRKFIGVDVDSIEFKIVESPTVDQPQRDRHDTTS